jgi:tetratricopeptide (TPR) repeat protein
MDSTRTAAWLPPLLLACWILAAACESLAPSPAPPPAPAVAKRQQLLETLAERQKTLQTNPRNWSALQDAALAQLLLERYGQARDSLERLPEDVRIQPGPRLMHAVALLGLGEAEQALHVCRESAQDDSDLDHLARRFAYLLARGLGEAHAIQALAREFAPARPPQNNRLAALPLHPDADTPELQAVNRALYGFLVHDLRLAAPDRVTPPEFILALLRRTPAPGHSAPLKQAVHLARLCRAHRAAFGRLELAGGSLEANLGLADTQSSSLLESYTARSRPRHFFQLEKDLLFHLLRANQIEPPPANWRKLRQAPTLNYQAAADYGRGLAALDRGEWETADRLFRQALDKDDTFQQARRRLIACPAGMGVSLEDLQGWAETWSESPEKAQALPRKLARLVAGAL